MQTPCPSPEPVPAGYVQHRPHWPLPKARSSCDPMHTRGAQFQSSPNDPLRLFLLIILPHSCLELQFWMTFVIQH